MSKEHKRPIVILEPALEEMGVSQMSVKALRELAARFRRWAHQIEVMIRVIEAWQKRQPRKAKLPYCDPKKVRFN